MSAPVGADRLAAVADYYKSKWERADRMFAALALVHEWETARDAAEAEASKQ